MKKVGSFLVFYLLCLLVLVPVCSTGKSASVRSRWICKRGLRTIAEKDVKKIRQGDLIGITINSDIPYAVRLFWRYGDELKNDDMVMMIW